jgi:heat shock protein HslJ
MKFHPKHKASVMTISAVVLIVLIGFVVYAFVKTSEPPVNQGIAVGEPYSATLTGTYLCLPHKDTKGPQTQECALGLETEKGVYYALDFNMLSQPLPTIAGGERITASGTVVPVQALSSDNWQKYPIVGIFSVTGSLKIEGKFSPDTLLLGSEWIWQSTQRPNGVVTSAPVGGKFALKFAKDKTMTGTTDCNTISGSFTLNEEVLSFKPFAMTKKFCEGSIEAQYVQDLGLTTSYVIDGSELHLNLNRDAGIMVFVRKTPYTSPQTGTQGIAPGSVNLNGSTFRLFSFDGARIPQGTNYTLTFTDKTLGAKFCNGMGGDYTLKDGIIKAQLVGTLMFCSEPADLMNFETTFGRILNEGAGFILQGSTLTITGSKGEKMVFAVFMD